MSDAWTAIGAVAALVAAVVAIWGSSSAGRSARDAKDTQRLGALDELHAALVRMSEITTLIGHEGWPEWKRLRDRLPALIARSRAPLPATSKVAAIKPEHDPDSVPDRPGVRRTMIVEAIAEVESAMRDLA